MCEVSNDAPANDSTRTSVSLNTRSKLDLVVILQKVKKKNRSKINFDFRVCVNHVIARLSGYVSLSKFKTHVKTKFYSFIGFSFNHL